MTGVVTEWRLMMIQNYRRDVREFRRVKPKPNEELKLNDLVELFWDQAGGLALVKDHGTGEREKD